MVNGTPVAMGPASGARGAKLHLGVDEATGELAAAAVSTNEVGDSETVAGYA